MRSEVRIAVSAPTYSGEITREGHELEVKNLSAFYGAKQALEDVSIKYERNMITAMIGPSGCGKSTLIRCLNRMHEVIAGATVQGEVLLNGQNIYAKDADPVRIRRRIGMVFQKPNPFPTLSIYDNVIAGYKLNVGRPPQGTNFDEIVEKALRSTALWDEVKDKLRDSGGALSGGQQQRLCIARAVAIEPDILLMDEPCSALDPISTVKVEELMQELRSQYTLILVTHNMQQAARVSDKTAFFLADERRIGMLIEFGPTQQLFEQPEMQETADYISGRFG
ncbi:MAG: phosphate ABC transporter ATP-binding protein PstB [Chloroflexota bacterium]